MVCTRTHDNDTSLSWYENLSLGERQRLRDYLDFNVEANIPGPLIRCALASIADMVMQGVLGLVKATA